MAITVFSSCGHFERDRKYYAYYTILATNDTLDQMTKQWYTLLNKAIRDRTYMNLTPQRLKMGEYLSRKRNEVANLNVTTNMATILDSELVFLSTRASIVSEVYPKFEPFNELTPNETVSDQLKSLNSDQGNLYTGNAAITNSLKAFATRNNLKIAKGTLPVPEKPR